MTFTPPNQKANYILLGRLNACRKLASDKLCELRVLGENEIADAYGSSLDLLLETRKKVLKKLFPNK